MRGKDETIIHLSVPTGSCNLQKKKKKRTKKEIFFFREYGGVVYILYRRPMEACGIG